MDTNVIGIDLGTTNSVAAIMKNGIPTIIKNDFNESTTPSIVHFGENQETVGNEARKYLLSDPKNTIFASKRLIGRKYFDPVFGVGMKKITTDQNNGNPTNINSKDDDTSNLSIPEYLRNLPYNTIKVCNGDIWIKTDFGKLSPTQIAAKILSKIKYYSSKALGVDVKRAVVTVPAYFNDSQRQATKDAGRIAGLDIIRVINEPTAAALAYGIGNNAMDNLSTTTNMPEVKNSDGLSTTDYADHSAVNSRNGHIAVYDLGGGTFDISILELSDGIFHVKSTNGNTFLGGEDFDNEFVKFLLTMFEQQEGVKLSDNMELHSNGLGSPLERLKQAAEMAKMELSTRASTNVFIENIISGVDFDIKVTRQQLEGVIKRIAMKTVGPCIQAIKDAGISKSDIKQIVLVGGMTRMPCIKELVKEIFKYENDPSSQLINSSMLRHPIIHDSLKINPDEAVAKGAAIQAGVLAGTVDNVLLLDVIPLSLGIETLGGVFNKIIHRNSTIPFKQNEVFSTSEDYQEEVDIRIYQGERAMVSDNQLLGTLKLKNIPPAKRGEAKITVTFETDANGILNVYAENSGNTSTVQIKPSTGLTEEQVQKMVDEAVENAKEDGIRRERSEFKIKYWKEIENLLSLGNLPSKTRMSIKALKDMLNGDFDLAEVKEKLREIQRDIS